MTFYLPNSFTEAQYVFQIEIIKKTHPNSCQDAPRFNFREVCNAVTTLHNN